jgi:hypothetical protein
VEKIDNAGKKQKWLRKFCHSLSNFFREKKSKIRQTQQKKPELR